MDDRLGYFMNVLFKVNFFSICHVEPVETFCNKF
jgi:hypothetical protein